MEQSKPEASARQTIDAALILSDWVNALQDLVKEGWIERIRGSGMFVAD